MADRAGQIPLAERTDIHKACKSLETLINVLNDFCEAAGAITSLEKKLAKALRDTAAQKVTGDVAANALNTSAVIFEVLYDIDNKFAKLVDKEYDNISTEVKQWFKKLTKEEKAFNEKMLNADARIKQAGQAYEKKSKKNPRDASEEHARYINLISTLGPEITQEKYNHALTVTQRHTTTTYGVASCLSRIADAEWLRSCEGVRKCSPSVGKLGEFRALCEGGWMGPFPEGLPDSDVVQQDPATTDAPPSAHPEERRMVYQNDAPQRQDTGQYSPGVNHLEAPRHEGTQRSNSPSRSNTGLQTYESTTPNRSTTPSSDGYDRSLLDFPRPLVDANTGSVRSLSAFPAPPTFLPLPRSNQSRPSNSSPQPSPSGDRLTESPIPEDRDDETPQATWGASRSRDSNPQPEYQVRPLQIIPKERPPAMDSQNQLASYQTPNHSGASTSAVAKRASLYEQRASETSEFGMRKQTDGNQPAKSPASARARAVERTDTGDSSGSVVAAMRNRYSSNAGSMPLTPKDVPKLPLSVTDLASRYRPGDYSNTATSPRTKEALPPLTSRYTQPHSPRAEDTGQSIPDERREANPSGSKNLPTNTATLNNSSQPREEPAPTQRDQRDQRDLSDHNDNERREQAYEERERQLHEMEAEIQRQAQELERERERLLARREEEGPTQIQRSPNQQHHLQQPTPQRERRTSHQGTLSPPPPTPPQGQGEAISTAMSSYSSRPHSQSTSQLSSAAGTPNPSHVSSSPNNNRSDPTSSPVTKHSHPQSPAHQSRSSRDQNERKPTHQSRHSYQASPLPPIPTAQQLQMEQQQQQQQQQHFPSTRASTSSYPTSPGPSEPTSPTSTQYQAPVHHPACGCEACSISKYRTAQPPSPWDLRPPEKPFALGSEKPKTGKGPGGWMRRLSMPAFAGGDPRAGGGNSIGGGGGGGGLSVGGIGGNGGPGLSSRNLLSMDGKKNTSTATLKLVGAGIAGGPASEDGRFANFGFRR